jgi:hypothetical protein
MKLIDGIKIQAEMKAEIAKEVAEMVAQGKKTSEFGCNYGW